MSATRGRLESADLDEPIRYMVTKKPYVSRRVLLCERQSVLEAGGSEGQVYRRLGMSRAGYIRAMYRARLAGEPGAAGWSEAGLT